MKRPFALNSHEQREEMHFQSPEAFIVARTDSLMRGPATLKSLAQRQCALAASPRHCSPFSSAWATVSALFRDASFSR